MNRNPIYFLPVRNWIHKASISQNGIGSGSGIGIESYLKSVFATVVTHILKKLNKKQNEKPP